MVSPGAHSQRWLQFPLTPPQVPLFVDHSHYIRWMNEQLELGTMRNVRHLWTSVRPNGDDRPHDLNRLEIRICDLISDPLLLLAVTAFAELRLQQILQDPARHDPRHASRLDLEELADLADANDQAAARFSLDADLRHWRTGETIQAREWISAELQGMAPLAADLGLSRTLEPLRNGAPGRAIKRSDGWPATVQGMPIGSIIAKEAANLETEEHRLEAWLATEARHLLG